MEMNLKMIEKILVMIYLDIMDLVVEVYLKYTSPKIMISIYFLKQFMIGIL